ncbi:MAG: 4-hydroxy-tetrahydrodipicolinate synthase [Puniceicoccales bacterium]|jgi:4-hydroxy-tetrahydrodipicolinate synthase|nr:4-hydroxy-tetrahydrodipicolinate synthase [Puniceicoccales bacterium]
MATASLIPDLLSARFSGTFTALVTPFKDGNVAYDDLRNLVEFQIANGVNGVASVGTTGESPTLNTDEHLEVIARTIEFARGRIPVLAGTGSNSTAEAVFFTQHADKAGADALLIVAPYYNKPTQEGIYRHFATLADATAKPIILYSIPSRCGVEIATETVLRLRQSHPNIVAIKEAGGSTQKVAALVRTLDPDFTVLSGDDALTVPFIELGARGVISVASNWLPAEVAKLTSLALSKEDPARAASLNALLAEVFQKIFIESNPVPIKYLLARSNIIGTPQVRLPLVELAPDNQTTLESLWTKWQKD